MRHRARLRVESLELRDTPATFGIPWPDAERLTLSFAPDGTAVGGRDSSLSSLLSTLGPDSRRDVLRAFQAWAAHANVNVGLVADDGSAFGVGGATQGDPRFGDVRVGGVPLPADVLAVTAPYSPLDGHSGDVVVNTAGGYGDGTDLYTALLQEAGHALGVGNSPDPASAMYEFYAGPRGGLAAADVAAVQALYGTRLPDRFEGWNGNDTPAVAAVYTGPLRADLTTARDVDVYRITTGLLTRAVSIDLTAAGLSLLTAKVEVLDATGARVTALLTTDPTSNDLTLSLGSVRRLATYYVRVSAAAPDEFGVGAYKLSVTQHSLLSDVTGLVFDLLDETGLNDTLATATTLLSTTATVAPRTEYVARGGFGSATDADVYRVTVPPSADGDPVNLLATVWGHDGAALDPWVEAADGFGRALAAEVLTANGNATTVQLRGVTPGRSYFLKLTSDSGRRGAYTFAADLRADAVVVPTGETRTLTPTDPVAAGGLTVRQSGQVYLVLTADGAAAGPGVALRVTAADGTVVATLGAAAGRSRSTAVFLPAGDYTLRFVAPDPSAPVSFRLGVTVRTDPIGATPIDSTDSPEPVGPPPPPSDCPPCPPTEPTVAEHHPEPVSSPGWDEPTVWY